MRLNAQLIILALFVSTWSGPVIADGMMVPSFVAGSEAGVVATQQRVLLLVEEGVTEITIEPVFQREAGAAAWVVPFPVQPEVFEGEPGLLDQLNLISSPVFIELCWDPSCGCYCPGDEVDAWEGAETAAGGYSGGVHGATPSVTVWQHGAVGALNYVVLSATGGGALVQWIEANGFVLPETFAAVLADFDTEDVFFFVARISEDADPERALAPVRFVLPGMTSPTYPLRLTRAGVAADAELVLTVWVVSSEEQAFRPSSHAFGEPEDVFDVYGWTGVGEYHEQLDDWLQGSGNEIARVYSYPLAENVYLSEDCHETHGFYENYYYYDDYGVCVNQGTVASELVPGDWSPELVKAASADLWLHRFEARLPPDSMVLDLGFMSGGNNELDRWGNVYANETGPCYECSTCPPCPQIDAGGNDISWWEDVRFEESLSRAEGEAETVADTGAAGTASDGGTGRGCGAESFPVTAGALWLVLALLAVVRLTRRA